MSSKKLGRFGVKTTKNNNNNNREEEKQQTEISFENDVKAYKINKNDCPVNLRQHQSKYRDEEGINVKHQKCPKGMAEYFTTKGFPCCKTKFASELNTNDVDNSEYEIINLKKGGKTRKHQGIHQSGGKKGKLKKGYRYSGKKLKSGLAQIIKCKRKK